MATTCVARIAGADVKIPMTEGVVPSSFGKDPKTLKPFSFASPGQSERPSLNRGGSSGILDGAGGRISGGI